MTFNKLKKKCRNNVTNFSFHIILVPFFIFVLYNNAFSKAPPESFADLSDQVSPAVVKIKNKNKKRNQDDMKTEVCNIVSTFLFQFIKCHIYSLI
jgi:hypothetical protein